LAHEAFFGQRNYTLYSLYDDILHLAVGIPFAFCLCYLFALEYFCLWLSDISFFLNNFFRTMVHKIKTKNKKQKRTKRKQQQQQKTIVR